MHWGKFLGTEMNKIGIVFQYVRGGKEAQGRYSEAVITCFLRGEASGFWRVLALLCRVKLRRVVERKHRRDKLCHPSPSHTSLSVTLESLMTPCGIRLVLNRLSHVMKSRQGTKTGTSFGVKLRPCHLPPAGQWPGSYNDVCISQFLTILMMLGGAFDVIRHLYGGCSRDPHRDESWGNGQRQRRWPMQ